MFRASSCPSSGSTTTAVAASDLPSELGDSSVVGRGRADHHHQHCYLLSVTAVVVAPDDGHEDARNVLSCI
jgi:hypothetical protein